MGKKESKLKKAQENYTRVSHSLDPAKFTWNKNCKKGCYGRGIIGYNVAFNQIELCTCAKYIKEAAKDSTPPTEEQKRAVEAEVESLPK